MLRTIPRLTNCVGVLSLRPLGSTAGGYSHMMPCVKCVEGTRMRQDTRAPGCLDSLHMRVEPRASWPGFDPCSSLISPGAGIARHPDSSLMMCRGREREVRLEDRRAWPTSSTSKLLLDSRIDAYVMGGLHMFALVNGRSGLLLFRTNKCT